MSSRMYNQNLMSGYTSQQTSNIGGGLASSRHQYESTYNQDGLPSIHEHKMRHIYDQHD